ncbi:MAG: 23S rRNA (pseudouridine(1915)-N(3))-methyltransferase RlmH [Bacteroidales bacterium]|nr:23S rRNA (pseudouridine(1915)-N(3))-methyltransferase RlmH [Bacteroidales bacterium]
MKVLFVQTGKTSEKYIAEGVSVYEPRIKRYIPFETITIPVIKNARNLTPDEVKRKEGKLLLDMLPDDVYVVLLDERGTEMTTSELASFMRRSLSVLRRNICFVTGGAWGFSPEVYARADMKLALSRLTFPHQLVRLLFVEQLYRVFSLIEGTPYHHE